jgi:hypothetical protein
VLAVLGGLVLLLGVGLPAGMDAAFEYVVGLTLVTLGAVVLFQLGRYRSDYRYTGRISLVVGGAAQGLGPGPPREVPGRRARRRPARALPGRPAARHRSRDAPPRSSSSPASGRPGSTGAAVLVLGAFVAGLVVADLGIAAAWLSGVLGSRRAPRVQVGLGLVTGWPR